MAVCEIWDVRGRLDHPIDYAENPAKTANPKYTEADLQAMVDVMEYATNRDKTEQRFFVTGVNCDPTTARDEMMIAKVTMERYERDCLLPRLSELQAR
ncbi:Relaxase/mobilization nuclease domain protein [human gut metagenome]|uniref:Relaxase/mobilization nuclease domain protein n=1 Tax=human gut metagenome TaxID=408170 RepID=K1RP59_9ZZZZ